MPFYNIRPATKDDIAVVVQLTLDMAMETEGRVLDGSALTKGMHVTFDRPNLADYYVIDYCSLLNDSEENARSPSYFPAGATNSEDDCTLTFPLPTDNETSAGAVVTSPSSALLVSGAKTPRVIAFMMTAKDYRIRTATSVQLIQTVYVTPEHRRHGLFRRFYEYVKEHVVSGDDTCEGIWLYVEKENVSGIAAYTKMGMLREDKHMLRWSKCGF